MRATAQQLKGNVGEAIALTSRAISIMKQRQNRNTATATSANATEHDTETEPSSSSTTTATTTALVVASSEDIADALLFLGKLYQLQGGFGNAFESFSEARHLYQQIVVVQEFQPQTEQHTEQQPLQPHQQQLQQRHSKKKELTALSHMASARSRWLAEGDGDVNDIDNTIDNDNDNDVDVDVDELFHEALEGLEEICGWKDGMTNHTAHEWSLHARRGSTNYNSNSSAIQNNTKTTADPRKALSILTNMKQKLAGVFGPNDHRVLQLNGELAELWHLVSALPSSLNGTNDTTATATSTTTHTTTTSTSCSTSSSTSTSNHERHKSGGRDDLDTTTTAEENAMVLLEEALDNLPPNSPEARRIFMQLEEWKDQQQQYQQQQQQNHHHDASGGIAAPPVGGVAVTFTKGRGRN
jgi:hypothetical protein